MTDGTTTAATTGSDVNAKAGPRTHARSHGQATSTEAAPAPVAGTNAGAPPNTDTAATATAGGPSADTATNVAGTPGLGEKEVWVLREGRPQMLRIKPGISDGTATEVLAGDLHEGDLVITDVASAGAAAGGAPAGPPPGMRRMF